MFSQDNGLLGRSCQPKPQNNRTLHRNPSKRGSRSAAANHLRQVPKSMWNHYNSNSDHGVEESMPVRQGDTIFQVDL